MSVTHDEVFRMAELARLELEESEAEGLRADLNGILEHMEALGGVPVDTPELTEQAHREGPAPMREDGAARPDRPVRPLAEIAPSWVDGFFTVPRLPGLEAVPDDRASNGEALPEEAPKSEAAEPANGDGSGRQDRSGPGSAPP